MDVFFETSKGKKFEIEIGFFDTVGEIKEKIQKYQGYPISDQKLFFKGQELANDRDTEHYEILQNSCIHLKLLYEDSEAVLKLDEHSHVPRPSPSPVPPTASAGATPSKKLKLMVLTKCGTKKIPVEVNALDNVSELRKELQRLHGQINFHLPSEGYFFIYKQNVMDDDRSFRWHEVRQGDTIEIFNGSVTGGS